MKTWTNIDKSEWDRGPWDTEPDKAQWYDEETGAACLIVRNDSGALCGYAGVEKDHPMFGIGYDDSPAYSLDVHGGPTFANSCLEVDGEPGKGVCHVPDSGRTDQVWWFGFDCAHYQDLSPAYAHRFQHSLFPASERLGIYRDFDYVKREVANLAKQLHAIGQQKGVGNERATSTSDS